MTNRRLREHLLPASLCVAALIALGLTPFFVAWFSGYGFACPMQQYDVTYYLQLAAQPYYTHALYLSDPMIPGGASFYPWLQYIPFVLITRWLGLSVFWIQIVWTIAAALGGGVAVYLFLWLVCRNRWLAAGITICVWADIDLAIERFAHRFLFIHQIYLTASDSISYLFGWQLADRPNFPWQWRFTNPLLDLPFLFLSLVVTSIAREHPSRRNIALSGLVFALTFYVYFYLWTMVAAGLCLAILVDRSGRRVYTWTLGLGIALGWPQIAHDFLVKRALSAQGLKYFELLVSVPAPNSWKSPYFHPELVIVELLIIGAWLIRRKLHVLTLAWCMTAAGFCLSLSNLVMSIYLHNYHWCWLVAPLMHILMVAVVLDLIMLWMPRVLVPGRVFALLVCGFLASGIYLTASIYRLGFFGGYIDTLRHFAEYNKQRIAAGVAPLRPDSVIAGNSDFVDFSAVAERQRPLGANFLFNNLVLDDEQRENRYVLDQYLSGTTRKGFVDQLGIMKESGYISKEEYPIYLRKFDEVSRDTDKAIDALKVRYVVIRADRSSPTFLTSRWNLIQPGPYWKIWERTEDSTK